MQLGLDKALTKTRKPGPQKGSRKGSSRTAPNTGSGENRKRKRDGENRAPRTSDDDSGDNVDGSDLLDSLLHTDVVAEAHTSAALPEIPGFSERDKGKALAQLLASIPAADQQEAKSDRNKVLQATRKITTKAKSDGKGGWKIKGLNTSLYHYQVGPPFNPKMHF